MEIVEHGHGMELAHDDHHHGMSAERHNYNLKMGWWLYIASEVMLFSSMIGAYLLAKSLYPEQHEILRVPLVTFNTFLLLSSSWTMARAVRSVQLNNIVNLQRNLFLTLALGIIFISIQVFEYGEASHEGLTLTSSMYGSAFYVLTGFHGLHVFIGVLWLLWAFIKSLNGYFNAEKYIGIEVLGLYWHFVDVVWVFLFPLIYLLDA